MRKIIKTEAELDDIREQWRDFTSKVSGFEVFFSHEWIKTWFDYFIKNNKKRSLHIIVEVDESKNEITSIVPLYREKFFYFFTSIRFISDNYSDYLGILTGGMKGFSAAAGAVEDLLVGGSGSPGIIYLKQVPEEQALALKNLLAGKSGGISLKMKESGDCYFISLPKSAGDYLKMFNSKQRYNIIKRVKNAEEKGARFVSFDYNGRPELLSSHIKEFFDLHQKRWNEKGKEGVFRSKKIKEFFSDLFLRLHEAGFLKLSFLKIGDKSIAGQVCFDLNGKREVCLPGFDPAYSSLHPGIVLTFYEIRDSTLKGLREFDFLKGGEGYKKGFLAVKRPNFKLYLFRNKFFFILFRINTFLRNEIFSKIGLLTEF